VQNVLVSYLPAVAAVRLGLVSKVCHELYPKHIHGKLALNNWRWGKEKGMEGGNATDDGKWMLQVMSNAKHLARFLRQMPQIGSIELKGGDGTSQPNPLEFVLGQALLSLPPREHLSEIELGVWGLGKAKPDGEFHLLVQAIAEGKTPRLRRLIETEACFDERTENMQRLAEALGNGYLPCLTELRLMPDTLEAFWSAFGRRVADKQLQAMVEELEVGEDDDEVQEEEMRALKALLLLPCFGRLNALNVVVSSEAAESHLGVVTAYAQHTKGAPCLRSVRITIPSSYTTIGPRFPSLFKNGGLVNLTHLHLEVEGESLTELGDVYRGGGLANLQELHFGWVSSLNKGQVNSWMLGVLSSRHKGAALRQLHFQEILHFDTEAGLAFVEALQNGAYRNLEVLQVESDDDNYREEDEGPAWSNDEVVKAAFLVAMARGAPCGRTLRLIWLGEMTQKQSEAFKQVLPQVLNWAATVRVVGGAEGDDW
jgi:hypothetical protein